MNVPSVLFWNNRLFDMEMQNDSKGDNIPKRARFYQGLLDSPVLKSGKHTKYRQLSSSIIIFITQDDLWKKDLARYTFTEQCEEIRGLHLEDGTTKIFLNMTSENGSKELVSLLKYMKDTTLDNPEILVKDERLIELDAIVTEVRESEEWEAVQMNIMEIAMERGLERGLEQGLEKGIEQGENRLNLLYENLFRENRVDDIKRSMKDVEYRRKLYTEYHI